MGLRSRSTWAFGGGLHGPSEAVYMGLRRRSTHRDDLGDHPTRCVAARPHTNSGTSEPQVLYPPGAGLVICLHSSYDSLRCSWAKKGTSSI
jgi:hypothetical protein